MMHRDIIIIGGGAAGLFAAARAVGKGKTVTVLERMERCGRKIGITAKGRCNLTNTRPWEEFSRHVHPQNTFFKNAFFCLDNIKTMDFFESIGLELTVERGARVFPRSMNARDVTDSLVSYILGKGGEILTGCRVESVLKKETGDFEILAEGRPHPFASADIVLLATGGLSYPATGSTGDGYRIARELGHDVTRCFPSLTALRPAVYGKEYEGISLKNVEVELYVGGRSVATEFGDLDFTSGGIEGPIGLRVSRKAVEALINGEKTELVLDLKPALSLEKLKERIRRELAAEASSGEKGPRLKYLLSLLMPRALILPFMRTHPDLTADDLPAALKQWRFPIESYVGYERAVVTAGGISLKDVSRKSMESKLVKGLYFAGEILDLDGDTGGYNLQIAFSTASLAVEHALTL